MNIYMCACVCVFIYTKRSDTMEAEWSSTEEDQNLLEFINCKIYLDNYDKP